MKLVENGEKAFEEREAVVHALGDNYGKGFMWTKVQKEKLQLPKSCLKGDYKVSLFARRNTSKSIKTAVNMKLNGI